MTESFPDPTGATDPIDSSQYFGSTALLGVLPMTFTNAESLAQLSNGVEKWNAWRSTTFQTPNLTRAELGGPKWGKLSLEDATATLEKISNLGSSPEVAHRATRIVEYFKDLAGREFTRRFPQFVPILSVLPWTALQDYLQSTFFQQFYFAHVVPEDFDEWMHPLWAIVNSQDLRKIDLGSALLSDANLRGADLRECNLSGADLRGADLSWADLRKADLSRAQMCGAVLRGASFVGADLTGANISNANLEGANLQEVRLRDVHLENANLQNADLSSATIVRTDLTNAIVTGARVYGVSAWDVCLSGTIQTNLVVTPFGQPEITVDNIEIAQFIYLLLNNARIRHLIDTITSKVVLILGRFTPERKIILDAIRDALRKRDYLPIVFDFEGPESRDLTGTVTTLANLARFVIADLTDPSSVPHELAMIASGTIVPIQAIILEGQQEYSMFHDLRRKHHWVLDPYRYRTQEMLLEQLKDRVIAPAETKVRELRSL